MIYSEIFENTHIIVQESKFIYFFTVAVFLFYKCEQLLHVFDYLRLVLGQVFELVVKISLRVLMSISGNARFGVLLFILILASC